MSLLEPVLVLLSLVPLIGPPQVAQRVESKQTLQERLQEELDSFWQASDLPGVTAGIALPDGTSLGLAAGYSDLELQTPMKPQDRLLAASVGKTFVAAIVLQLVQQGQLKLDDPLQKFLGEEEWFDRLSNSRDIKVRMLLNHTSGVAPHMEADRFVEILGGDRDKVWSPEELISLSLDRPALFKAGTEWAYSDTNYILAGMIIERITHEPYYRTLEKRLLKPLGLRDTLPSDSRRVAGLVPGYQSSDSPIGSPKTIVDGLFFINLQYEWTGGGLASTARDLARWAFALYEGQAFNQQLLEEMLEGMPTPMGARYGLGVIISETPLGTSYGHSGTMPGYLTTMMYFPKHRFAIAAQFNTTDPKKASRELLFECVTRLGQALRD